MKNNKGFTLIELIVVIAIMGVILILALPQVSKLKSANKDKKYDAYYSSIENGAKLYIDNQAKDLFGSNSSGCVTVKYSDLKKQNLVKDFASSDVFCDKDNETYVEVRKANDNFLYSTSLVCHNRDNGKVVYKKREVPTESCTNEPDKAGPTVTITPKKHDWVQTKKLKIDIKVSDEYTLNKNVGILYYWTNSSGIKVSKDYTYNYKNKKGVKSVTYQIPTKNIPTDSGEYNLVVRQWISSSTSGIQDILGNQTVGDTEAGIYKLDNLKPIMTPKIVSKNQNYQSLDTVITIEGSDNVGIDQMYISNKEYETGENWVTYKNTFDWTLDGTYNGEERIIYITIKDYAGNKTNTPIKYTVYESCKDQENDGNWYDITNCSASCGTSGTKTQQIKRKDKYTGVSCGTRNQSGIACNRFDCCSSVRYENGSSCSKSCGGGTYNQLAYSKYNGQRCSSKDKTSGGSVCNTKSCKPATPTINNPTKEKWVNYNFALTVSTSTASSSIGYWQYKYASTKWSTYQNSATNNFKTTNFSAERNELVYIRVCTPTGVCSDDVSTYIRIDKTKPFYTSVAPYCGDPLGNGTRNYVKLYFSDILSGLGIRYAHSWDSRNNTHFKNQNFGGKMNGSDLIGNSDTWIGIEHTICDVAGNCNSWNDSNVKFNCSR